MILLLLCRGGERRSSAAVEVETLINEPARRGRYITKRLYMRPAPAVDYAARLMPHRNGVAILLENVRSDTVENQNRENKKSFF